MQQNYIRASEKIFFYNICNTLCLVLKCLIHITRNINSKIIYNKPFYRRRE